MNMSFKPNSCLHICIIGNEAFSLLNFRGPLIADMARRGIKVFALAPDYDRMTRAAVRALEAEPVAFSLSRTGMNPVRDAADILRLASLFRKLKPDIILAYVPKPVIYGTLAAWLACVPRRFALITGLGYAFTPSATGSSKHRLMQHIVLHLYRAALRHADKVFFQNDDDRALLVKEGAVRAAQAIQVNGTGVDLDFWRPAPPVTKPVTFLLAARLLREKGILEFVEAAKWVKARYPGSRFILLGGLDSHPGALSRSEVDGWVNESILEWPGHVMDVRPWLAQASVYVLPSYYREGIPRSTQEAMAMARPVITTNAPGCRDTVIDGKNGFLVPVRDSKVLAAAMERFILQPELIWMMGQASREIAQERFDVRRINQIILKEMGIC